MYTNNNNKYLFLKKTIISQSKYTKLKFINVKINYPIFINVVHSHIWILKNSGTLKSETEVKSLPKIDHNFAITYFFQGT